MNEKISELKQKLDNLHTALTELSCPQKDLIALGAYTFPFIHWDDLVCFPQTLSAKLAKMSKYEPSSEDEDVIDSIIYALDHAQPNIDHITHSNASVSQTAIYSFLLSMLFISNEINELFSFSVLKDKDLLPKK